MGTPEAGPPSATVWRTWSPDERRLQVVAWVRDWVRAWVREQVPAWPTAANFPPITVTVAGAPALPVTVGVAVHLDPQTPGLILSPALVWGDDPAAVWHTVARATQHVCTALRPPETVMADSERPSADAPGGATL